MPIYLSKKTDFSIPRDSLSENNDPEAYLENPDLLFDKLPQPFRFINKLVDEVVGDAWTAIRDGVEKRAQLERESDTKSVESSAWWMECGAVRSLCSVGVRGVLTAFSGALVLQTVGRETAVDCWRCDDENVTMLRSVRLCNDVDLVSAADDDGSGKLYAVSHGRIYLVKKWPATSPRDQGAPNPSSMQSHITTVDIDSSSSFVALSYDQFKENEQWVEVHRLPREAWARELEAVGSAYDDFLAAQSAPAETLQVGEFLSAEQTAVTDRYGVKTSPTTLVFKVKFPDPFSNVTSAALNLAQLIKQLDVSSSAVLGLGLNHGLTPYFLEAQTAAFLHDTAALRPTSDVLDHGCQELNYLARTAHVLWCTGTDPGYMCPAASSADITPDSRDAASLILWWTDCQHLLVYNLFSKPAKGNADSWTKPDVTRTFPCAITAGAISGKKELVAIGLDDGQLSVVNIASGLTKFSSKASNCCITEVRFIDSQDEDSSVIAVMDDSYRILGIRYSEKSYKFEPLYFLNSQENGLTYLKPLGIQSQWALSTSRNGQLALYDLTNGRKVVHFQLASQYQLISAWDPIAVSANSDRLICLAISEIAGDKDDEDEGPEKTGLFLYDLTQHLPPLPEEVAKRSISLIQDPAPSKLMQLATNLLQKRCEGCPERQKRLRIIWNSLESGPANSMAMPIPSIVPVS